MSTLTIKRRALVSEARFIGEKAEAESRDLTAEETARVHAIKSEVAVLDEKIEQTTEVRNAIKAAVGNEGGDSSPEGKAAPIGGGAQTPLAKAMMDALAQRPGGVKAVTVTAGSISVPNNLGVVGQPRDPNLLASVVAFVEQTATGEESQPDGVSYLRQISRTLAAAAVQRGAPKPESALSFERVNQAFATLAHIITVPNQWLQDSAKLAQLIQDEMVYGVMLAIDAMLLGDTIDEDGGTLHGLLTTTGVGRTAFVGDAVRTVRRALGSLEDQGITPSHVALNPSDWEQLETMQLTDGSYLLPDRPGGSGARRIWNTPVILASGLNAGTAVAGDFTTRSMGVATRGPVHLQWNPFSKDTTNETILRVEGRFTPVITRPGSFTVASLTGL